MNKLAIGIAGYGVIGQAVGELFSNAKNVETFIYDPYLYIHNMVEEEITDKMNQTHLIFVCVPTPHNKYEGLDMSIIESTVKKFNPDIFVICSALQPGTADRLSKKYNKRIVVQPEYFGETTGHPLTNLSQQQFLILGGETNDVNEVIKIYQKIYNANIKIRKVTALEAEIIKLSENRAIAYKVAQCQELYDACRVSGVDYETIRQAVYGDDPRFNLWWTWVYEDNRGFNSKCIPKDVYGWHKWAESNGVDPKLTRELIEYNDKLINDKK